MGGRRENLQTSLSPSPSPRPIIIGRARPALPLLAAFGTKGLAPVQSPWGGFVSALWTLPLSLSVGQSLMVRVS